MSYDHYKELVERQINDYLESNKVDPRLVDGMDYALQGGKRLRAAITCATLDALDSESYQVCLVPEFIHTASLIIDDLPAFDDAKTRRDKECLHIVKGEGLAYLLSFYLVTASLEILGETKIPGDSTLIYKDLIQNISGDRAIGGQLLSTFHTTGSVNLKDLESTEKMSREEIKDILIKKTSSFFEIALVTGWLVGGGESEKLPQIKSIAENLGLCYQIYDDFIDYEEDTNSETGTFSHNYVYHLGIVESLNDFNDALALCGEQLTTLGLWCELYEYLFKYMLEKIQKQVKVMRG